MDQTEDNNRENQSVHDFSATNMAENSVLARLIAAREAKGVRLPPSFRKPPPEPTPPPTPPPKSPTNMKEELQAVRMERQKMKTQQVVNSQLI